VWIRRQHGDLDSVLGVLEHMSYSPNRVDSELDPRAIVCDKLGSVIDVLIELKGIWETKSDGKETEDLRWAVDLLRAMSGPDGFNALAEFGVDTDFTKVNNLLLRVQDKSAPSPDQACPDVALSAEQCEQALLQSKELFQKLGVFSKTAKWTYTQSILRSLEKAREFRSDPTDVGFARIGWPPSPSSGVDAPAAAPSQDPLASAKQHARDLFPMVHEFYKLNFPGNDLRGKWAAFEATSERLPMETRIQYIKDLCRVEGLDGDEASETFANVFPRARKLAAELRCSRAAWTEIAEAFRRGGAKPEPWTGGSKPDKVWKKGAHALCELILTYICVLDVTTDIERLNAVIRRRESNGRQRHFDASTLRTELLLATEVPKDALELVDKIPVCMRPVSATDSELSFTQNVLRPRRLITRAQEYYKKFFGIQKNAGRGYTARKRKSIGFTTLLNTAKQGTCAASVWPRAAGQKTKGDKNLKFSRK
jgi:hypothetical protein